MRDHGVTDTGYVDDTALVTLHSAEDLAQRPDAVSQMPVVAAAYGPGATTFLALGSTRQSPSLNIHCGSVAGITHSGYRHSRIAAITVWF
ncbi:MAG: hypothetical protein ACWGPN_00930 [Gammaproteobacteria bacterium]